MLNRLYIVVGSLLIILIGAAFIVPHFVDWSDRRPQMEALAAEALGAKVTIAGPIDFELLPQPQLRMSDVRVGPSDAPVARIGQVTADFSLMDFLRDRFVVTHLAVQKPDIRLSVDQQGRFVAPIHLPASVSASNVSIADAELSQGSLSLTDQRTGESWSAGDIAGTLSLSALRGPFSLVASGAYQGRVFQTRVTTSPLNAKGEMQVSVFVQPADGGFTFTSQGTLATGARPTLKGKVHLAVAPPPQADSKAQGVRGNLVLDSDLSASPDQVLMSHYVLLPDANRAATRLTGAAVMHLGEGHKFDIVMSGGVVGLTPKDAREEDPTAPFALVTLLNELPAPFVPQMPGRIGLDVAELDVHAFALRNVRLDATTNGKDWSVSQFSGQLPGSSPFKFSGTLRAQKGRPDFAGTMSITTDRLDAIAQMWRKPDPNSPLFSVPADLESQVRLADDHLRLSKGAFTLDGVKSGFDLDAGLTAHTLQVHAALGALGPDQSQELLALLPGTGRNGAFGASFPVGSFGLSAKQATFFGLEGQNLAARGNWTSASIHFDHLSADDLGGLGVTLTGNLAGSAAEPILSGSGRVILAADAASRALPVLFDRFDVAPQLQTPLKRLLPLNVEADLGAANPDGGQVLKISGKANGADLSFDGQFAKGIAHALSSPLDVSAALSNTDPSALAELMGLPVALPQSGAAKLGIALEGTPSNSVDAKIGFDTDADKLDFDGNLVLTDLSAIRGRGQLSFDLPEPEAWGEVLGAGGLYAPALNGVGQLTFTGLGQMRLGALKVEADGATVTGELARSSAGKVPQISGAVSIDRVDLASVLGFIGSGSAQIGSGDGLWPDGPLVTTNGPRDARGRISVNVGDVWAGGQPVAKNASFDFGFDDKSVRLRSGTAQMGGGTASFDLGYCCSATGGNKQISGRIGVNGVALSALLPKASSQYLSGMLDGALQLSGTGASLADIVGGLAGSGSFSLSDLSVAGMAPGAFKKVAATKDILDLDAKALVKIAGAALASGPFAAPSMSGVISLAGGKLRADNLAAENDEGRLFGGVTLDLNGLGLAGSWELTPKAADDPSGLIDATTALITANLGGTLLAPTRTLDLDTMADAIKVKALEQEVARLQKLKAEKEARDRAEAEKRARLMALDAQKKAEEAAAKAAAEKAAADKAAQAQSQTTTAPATDTPTETQPSIDQLLQELQKTQQTLDATSTPSVQTLDAPPADAPIQLVPDASSSN